MDETCKHQTDFAMADIVGWGDTDWGKDWCEIEVVCVRYAIRGSVVVTPENIRWHDEDGSRGHAVPAFPGETGSPDLSGANLGAREWRG